MRQPPGRRYGQYCGIARALDQIGDRWTLLIVRELLAGPARYNDLRSGLPGIATNLLAERLRSLEGHGLVERRVVPEGGVAYALTPRGADLRPVLHALIRWSGPLMTTGRDDDDEFRPQWLALALDALLPGRALPRTSVLLRAGPLDLTLTGTRTGPSVELGAPAAPAAVVTAEAPEAFLAVASGAVPLPAAVRAGMVAVSGDIAIAEQFFGS